MKCLIADPSATQRRVIRNVLAQAGWDEIVEAPDGKLALELCGAGGLRLLITEWDLPGLTGIDLVTHIRGDAKTVELPILMVTTRNTREDVVEAVRAGVREYLLKPFSAETLRNRIDQFGITDETSEKLERQEEVPGKAERTTAGQAGAAPGEDGSGMEPAEPQLEAPVEEQKAA